MTEHAVLSADFATYKPVPTRKVLQLVLEVPLERQGEVFDKLGYPMPGESLPVAVVRLNETAAPPPIPVRPNAHRDIEWNKPSQPWHELSRAQQAGIRCGGERFGEFLQNRYLMEMRRSGHNPAECVRLLCAVSSRSELDKGGTPASVWDALDAEYRQWAGLDPEPRG